MPRLAIRLFNGFQALMDGCSISEFKSDKNRSLLAYLAVESGRSHRRDRLAALFWPMVPDTNAYNSLRQAIYQLRTILNQSAEKPPHLNVQADQVSFNPDSDHWIDLVEFDRRIASWRKHHPNGIELCAECIESLQGAIELYRGDFLAGICLPDCPQFSQWQLITQERYHLLALDVLTILEDLFERRHDYQHLIACTQREIELEPWREAAYRRQMWALALSGKRGQAIQQYEQLCEILSNEFGTKPVEETYQLYNQIRFGALPGVVSQHRAAWQFSAAEVQPNQKAARTIVARQNELAKLHAYLSDGLTNQGRPAFISGEAGSGKTALLNEFALRAMRIYPNLLVLGGACRTFNGLGVPYQPWLETLEMLFGNTPDLRPGSLLPPEHASRLSAAQPFLSRLVDQVGPTLAGTWLPARALAGSPHTLSGSEHSMKPGAQRSGETPYSEFPSSNHLESDRPGSPQIQPVVVFEQIARLLLAISLHFPLMIVLDDLQWADNASAGLLFYLGSRIPEGRILLLGAYRSEDLVFPRDGERHPLIPIMNEFQRRFGEDQIHLSQSDGKAFVSAYLDCEPNCLDRKFREVLFQETGGNPLFTIELVEAMKARGDIVQDPYGRWVVAKRPNWDQIPARVEAVISERLSRLDQMSLSLLGAASLQGEIFTSDVLADVMNLPEEKIMLKLGESLVRGQHLVNCIARDELANTDHARYRFITGLCKRYLQQNLNEHERDRLQRATTLAINKLRTTSPDFPGQ